MAVHRDRPRMNLSLDPKTIDTLRKIARMERTNISRLVDQLAERASKEAGLTEDAYFD